MSIPTLSVPDLLESARNKVFGHRFVKDVGVLTVSRIVVALAMLLQGIVVARWLGPEKYGIVALIVSYPNLLYALLDARPSDATVKYLGEFTSRRMIPQALALVKLSYVVAFSIGLAAFLIVSLTAWWAEDNIVRTPGVQQYIILFSLVFMPSALAGPARAILSIQERFRVIGFVDGFSGLLRAGLVLSLVALDQGIVGVLWGNAVGLAIRGIMLFLVAHVVVKNAWGGSWVTSSWQDLSGRVGEILRFMFYGNVNAIIGSVAKRLDVILLGYFRGPSEVGFYQLAKTLAGGVGYLVQPLQAVTYSRFSRIWGAGDIVLLKRRLNQLALQVGLPLFVVVGLAAIPMESIISLTVGEEYLPALTAARVLLIASAIWIGFFWLRPIFFTLGELKTWTLIGFATALLSAAGYAIVAPFWGYVGMAWVWLIVGGVCSYVAALAYIVHRLRVLSSQE